MVAMIGSLLVGRGRRRPARRFLALVAIGLLPTVAAATTVLTKSFSQLCAEADVIFVGTVTGVRSQWGDPSHRGIETLVTFDDLTVLHGDASGTYTLRLGGGEVDDIREEVAGVPQFAPGQRVVLFARQARSVSPIVGFNQGYFRVADGPRSPVILDAEGRAVLGVRNDAIETAPAAAGTESAVPLATFLETVRQQLTSRGRDS